MAKLFRLFFVRLAIERVHFGLQFCHVFGRDGRLVVVIVVVEEHGEHVGHGLALRVTHDMDGGIDTFSHQLMLQQIAATIAADDATHLPEAEVVQELTAGDSNLAYEQLIDVVGVYQFFSLSPFCFVPFDFLPGSGAYHAFLSSITLLDASTNSVGVALVRMSVIVTGASESG